MRDADRDGSRVNTHLVASFWFAFLREVAIDLSSLVKPPKCTIVLENSTRNRICIGICGSFGETAPCLFGQRTVEGRG